MRTLNEYACYVLGEVYQPSDSQMYLTGTVVVVPAINIGEARVVASSLLDALGAAPYWAMPWEDIIGSEWPVVVHKERESLFKGVNSLEVFDVVKVPRGSLAAFWEDRIYWIDVATENVGDIDGLRHWVSFLEDAPLSAVVSPFICRETGLAMHSSPVRERLDMQEVITAVAGGGLAHAAKELGVSQEILARILSRRRSPWAMTVASVAAALSSFREIARRKAAYA